ncbi:MAG TPA: DUF1003 domain-containing protein [Ignavibacteriaceae bacterium]
MITKNPNNIYKSILSESEKFAIWITDKVGTIGFFAIIFFWTLIWLSWNMFAPRELRFDPYPAFVLWLFISNMIQIFLMPLIMVGQNLQSKHAEIRAEIDFEVNVRAEKEIAELRNDLNEIKDLLNKLLLK